MSRDYRRLQTRIITNNKIADCITQFFKKLYFEEQVD